MKIFGFSCVHYGDRGHDKELWKRFLETVEGTPNAVVFGLGDYLDWLRTTHRVELSETWGGASNNVKEQYDDMLMHQLVYPFVDTVRQHCPSFASKCVGLCEGNHHGLMLSNHFRNGSTTTQAICGLLGVRYLGLAAWVRLRVMRSFAKGRKSTGAIKNLNLLLNHSTSTSGKLTTSLTSAQRRIEGWRGVDVALSANDHQLGHVLRQEIGCASRGKARMVMYQQIVGKVGSFQKSYQEEASSDSYVEKKLLSPAQLGWLSFDAHIYQNELTKAKKAELGLKNTSEVWRYENFNC